MSIAGTIQFPSAPDGHLRHNVVQRQAIFFTLSDLSNPEVGSRVRAYRKQAGLSQSELATIASEHLPPNRGLNQTDVSRLESDPGKARISTFVAVCKALAITLSDLLEETPNIVVKP